jgi:hypothetical protein
MASIPTISITSDITIAVTGRFIKVSAIIIYVFCLCISEHMPRLAYPDRYIRLIILQQVQFYRLYLPVQRLRVGQVLSCHHRATFGNLR